MHYTLLTFTSKKRKRNPAASALWCVHSLQLMATTHKP